MSTEMRLAKQAMHDKLMSQVNAAEAKLIALKARAEAAKAHLEMKAIAELLSSKPTDHPAPEPGQRVSGRALGASEAGARSKSGALGEYR
jgi:hypothetical protein